LEDTRAVCEKAAFFRFFSPLINRRQAESCGAVKNKLAAAIKRNGEDKTFIAAAPDVLALSMAAVIKVAARR